MDDQAQGFRRPDAAALATVTKALADTFGNRYSANATVRAQHAHTITWGPNQPPDCVVYPQSTEEVAEVAVTVTEAVAALRAAAGLLAA